MFFLKALQPVMLQINVIKCIGNDNCSRLYIHFLYLREQNNINNVQKMITLPKQNKILSL